MQLAMASVATSTNKSYDASWNQWEQFRVVRKEDPFMDGTEPGADQEVLLTWITFLHAVQKNAYNTIKNKVMAVRQRHLVAGFPDPLVAKPKVWLAFKGLKRLSPTTARINLIICKHKASRV